MLGRTAGSQRNYRGSRVKTLHSPDPMLPCFTQALTQTGLSVVPASPDFYGTVSRQLPP